jgi:hypothetical protein
VARSWGRVLTIPALVLCVGYSALNVLADSRPTPKPKQIAKPYTCKPWGYSFVVPHGWSSKNTNKRLDRCSGKNGASADFYSKDKRAAVIVTVSKRVAAPTMAVRILLAAGASVSDMRFSDRPIGGATFHIGTVAVPFRGDGTDYFFLTGCAEHKSLAFCLSGSIAQSGNYRFVSEEHAIESALLSFRFLPPPTR